MDMLIVFVAAAVSSDFIYQDAGAEGDYRCKEDLSEVKRIQEGLGNAAAKVSLEERAIDDHSEEVQEEEDNRGIEYRPRGNRLDDTPGFSLCGIVDDVVHADIKDRRYVFEHIDIGECLASLQFETDCRVTCSSVAMPSWDIPCFFRKCLMFFPTVFIRCLPSETIAESVGAILQLPFARRMLTDVTFA